MNETLRLLYDRFYTPLPMVESEQEVENCHQQLIERLDKPERKLVLRIIDAQNLMIEQRSVDSFICGFRLAWEMANELNHYKENRHPLSAEEAEADACSVISKVRLLLPLITAAILCSDVIFAGWIAEEGTSTNACVCSAVSR